MAYPDDDQRFADAIVPIHRISIDRLMGVGRRVTTAEKAEESLPYPPGIFG